MNTFLYSATGNLLWLIEDKNLNDGAMMDYASISIRLCQNQCADGLMLMNTETLELWIINRDGTNGKFCGNGVRAAAYHLASTRALSKATLKMAGQELEAKMNGQHIELCYSLSEPMIKPQLLEKQVQAYALKVPNPHLVIITPPRDFQLEQEGAALCKLYDSNIEFVHLENAGHVSAEVYERGVGMTQACGSGAIAILKVLRYLNLVNKAICIKMPGGKLYLTETSQGILLAGEVQFIRSEVI